MKSLKFKIQLLFALFVVPWSAVAACYWGGNPEKNALLILAVFPLLFALAAAAVLGLLGRDNTGKKPLYMRFHLARFLAWEFGAFVVSALAGAVFALAALGIELGAVLVLWIVSITLFVPYVLLFGALANFVFFRHHPELLG